MNIGSILLEFTNVSVLIAIILGTVAGIIGGALPGISPSMTITLILPVTLYMEPIIAIAVLMSAYQGSMFGGSISAILINAPGTASAAATLLDGYPMASRGESKKALQTALYSSCVGGLIGTVILLFSAKMLAKVALKFGPPEYFGLMLLSFTLIAGISGTSMLKGTISGGIGLIIASIGMDPIYGSRRLSFGSLNLSSGIASLSVFIGIFALSEIFMQISDRGKGLDKVPEIYEGSESGLTLKEFLGQKWNLLTSGIIGSLVGILPGVGASTASFMAYAETRRRSKYPEKFGEGIIDGIVAAEAANNAVCSGALVPMLTLGIPGDTVTAILVGALITHGISPGPMLFVENIGAVYRVYIALFFGLVALSIIGSFGVPIFSKIIKIKKSILLPCVFVICIVGTYASRTNYFDCYVMIILGMLGYILRKQKFPLSPLVIAYIIGGSLEANLRRTIIMGEGGLGIFATKPLALFLIVVSIVMTVIMVRNNMKLKAKQEQATSN